MESVVLGSQVSGSGHGSRYQFQLKKRFQLDSDAKWIQLSQLDAEQREAVVKFLAADRELVVPSSLKQSVDKVRHTSSAPSLSPVSADARKPYSDQERDHERGRHSVEDLETQSSYESDGLQDEVAQSEVYIKSPDSVPLVSPPPKTVLTGAGDSTSSLFDAAYMYSAMATASSNLLKPGNSNSNNGDIINSTNHTMDKIKDTSQPSRSFHPDQSSTTAVQCIATTPSPTGRAFSLDSTPQGNPLSMTRQDMKTSTTTTTNPTPGRLTPYPGPAATLKYLKDLNKKRKGEQTGNLANPFFPQ
ncbi:hypothetical protein VMCG_10723 [Cytospora schulzeri]|uniref:Uncharacterized protein n=1 Tax=Cytospora schulzeri TaxID=448051 RepID=A0A423V8X1_9PEZI|nr:hypothetical protein VMCG_10723 [Valsa malicola]